MPFFRSLFVAGDNWCDGIQPPASLWLGAPNEPSIVRDGNGNALVTHVGGQAVFTAAYRLPAVAVGECQYIPLAPGYDDGSFLGGFRAFAGAHVDLTDDITDHDEYVAQVTEHALELEALGYLLEADADEIIQRAIASDIGN